MSKSQRDCAIKAFSTSLTASDAHEVTKFAKITNKLMNFTKYQIKAKSPPISPKKSHNQIHVAIKTKIQQHKNKGRFDRLLLAETIDFLLQTF